LLQLETDERRPPQSRLEVKKFLHSLHRKTLILIGLATSSTHSLILWIGAVFMMQPTLSFTQELGQFYEAQEKDKTYAALITPENEEKYKKIIKRHFKTL
jgi:hypothetical protein